MRIGLIDVDSHNFPNLAQMKLSAYHKQRGDEVERWLPLKSYDLVYMSKVFDETYTEDEHHVIMADEIIKGGTGYDLQNRLPEEIEHIYPDYGLYNVKDKAIGFISRGCPRGCDFCIVAEKEGLKSRQVAELGEFWRGQKEIILLDPNLTACKDSERIFEELANTKAWIDFNQGIDARVLTDKHCDLLNRMKVKMIHFAWDNYEMKTFEKLKRIRPLINKDFRRLRVYVLTNFNTTMEQNLERVYKLKELDYDPYIMIYDKPNAPKELRQMARWVNNKYIFRTCETFEEYRKGRG